MGLFSRRQSPEVAIEPAEIDESVARPVSEAVARYEAQTDRLECLKGFANQFTLWGCESEVKDGLLVGDWGDDARSARELAVIATFQAIRR